MSETSVHPVSSATPNGVNLLQPQSETERNAATVTETTDAQESVAFDPPSEHSTVLGEVSKYVISFLILAMGAFVAFGLSQLKQPPQEKISKLLVPMVGTIEATPYAGQLDKVISGTVVPYKEIRVAAQVNGSVVEKYEAFEAGNFVKKDTVLLKIDPTDYQLLLETGLAEVEQMKKLLEETEREIEGNQKNIDHAIDEHRLADREYMRNKSIKGSLSESELDQSERSRLTATIALTILENMRDTLKARANSNKAALALSEAQLKRTRLNLKKTLVVAPVDGVVVREMVQEGDFVRVGDPLVTFEDTSRSEVICNLTPTDLAWVRSNAPASSEFGDEVDPNQEFSVYYLPKTRVWVYEPGNPTVKWEGILERFDGIGRDESTRTIPCRITIKNPVIQTNLGPRALVRGMYVKCKIAVETSADKSKRSFLSLPAVAVRPGNVVWVVRNPETDPRLEKLLVEVVDYGEQLVNDEIKKIVVIAENEDSVRDGDVVVTTPLSQPSNKAEVILETKILAAAKTDNASADSESMTE